MSILLLEYQNRHKNVMWLKEPEFFQVKGIICRQEMLYEDDSFFLIFVISFLQFLIFCVKNFLVIFVFFKYYDGSYFCSFSHFCHSIHGCSIVLTFDIDEI